MPEEKEISYSIGSGTINTTKKRRRNRRVTRSVEKAGMKGEEIVKTEQIVMISKDGEEPKGVRKATETIVKIIPYKKPVVVKDTKIVEPISAKETNVEKAMAPQAKVEKITKISVLPKTAKTKIKILAKNDKPVNKIAPKPLPTEADKRPAEKSKISLKFPAKTRKTYKERKLRIDL
uniref:Uncharacterized protein n=1 Tax=viral metagenome TaxID=1070528 RepID=A0A6C0BIG5_9ZZZZ